MVREAEALLTIQAMQVRLSVRVLVSVRQEGEAEEEFVRGDETEQVMQ